MKSFQQIGEKLYNFFIGRQQYKTISENQCNIFDEWMKRKFQSFIVSQFYCWQELNNKDSKSIVNASQFSQNQKPQNLQTSYLRTHKIDFEKQKNLWMLLKQEREQNQVGIRQQQMNIQKESMKQVQQKLQKLISIEQIKQIYHEYHRSQQFLSDISSSFKESLSQKDQYNKAGKASSYVVHFSTIQHQYQSKQQFYVQDHSMTYLIQKESKISIQSLSQLKSSGRNAKKIMIVNPSFQIFNSILLKYRLKNKTQNEKKSQQVKQPLQYPSQIFLRPEVIFLTSSSFQSILSTILMLHFVYYSNYVSQQKQNFSQLSKRSIIKVITTKQIYLKYLQVLKFLKLMNQFCLVSFKLANQQDIHKQLEEKQQSIQKIQAQFLKYCCQNHIKIQRKTHFILSSTHFHIVNPNQHYKFLNNQFCFKQINLFPYYTYDFQLSDQSNGQIIALIEGNHFKHVKNIYYLHKKGNFSEQIYLKIVKRLEQKQILSKNNQKIVFISSNCSGIIRNEIFAFKIFNVKVSFSVLNSKLDKIPNSAFFIKKHSITQQKYTQRNKKNSLNSKLDLCQDTKFHNPYEIEITKKNQIFLQMRRMQRLLLLSDCQLLEIINEGILIQYKKNQTIFSPCSSLQEVFFILDGSCLLNHKNIQEKSQRLYQNDIFGWKHFLVSKHSEKNALNIKNKYQSNQMKKSVIVFSSKLSVLRISITFLQYLLIDKIDILKETQFMEVNRQHKSGIYQKQILIPNINNQILQYQFKEKQNYFFLNKLLSVTEKKTDDLIHLKSIFQSQICPSNENAENNQFQLLRSNCPNLIILF